MQDIMTCKFFCRPIWSAPFPSAAQYRVPRQVAPPSRNGLESEDPAIVCAAQRTSTCAGSDTERRILLSSGYWALSGQEWCPVATPIFRRSEEHTSELQSLRHLVCRLL